MRQEMLATPLKTMEIGQIVTSFNCTICMDLVSEPLVIKHCLHFFCKKCIDKNILQFKKECPLCKIPLRTKRETRYYDKLRDIMGLVKSQMNDYSNLEIEQMPQIYEKSVA